MQAVAVAQLANFALGDAGQLGQTRIGEALAFQGAQERFVQAVDARFGHLFFQAHQLFNLHQEPAVDVGQVEDAVNRQTGAEGVGDVPDAVRAGVFQLAADLGQRFRIVQAYFRVEAGGTHFQTAQRFCSDSCWVRPMAITSPTDFIWVVRRSLAPANFSKLKRGILVTT